MDCERPVDTKRLYKKNIFKLIFAYVAWSMSYAFVWSVFKHEGLNGFLMRVIRGHYHMWFLPMLICLYIIVPLLRKITADETSTKYYLFVSFLFTFLVPVLLDLTQIINTELYNSIYYLYGNVHFNFCVGYSFYFILGHYMNRATIGKRTEIILYILGIIGFVATILLTKWYSYSIGAASERFYINLSINVLFEVVSVFIFVKCRLSRWLGEEKTVNFIRRLSKYSFGVYLVHPFLLAFSVEFLFETTSFGTLFSVPALALIVFLLSLSVSAILNKIPIVNKYLV